MDAQWAPHSARAPWAGGEPSSQRGPTGSVAAPLTQAFFPGAQGPYFIPTPPVTPVKHHVWGGKAVSPPEVSLPAKGTELEHRPQAI